MATNSSTSRRLAAAGFFAAIGTVLATATPAAGTSHSNNDAACLFDPASLPRTADAVDGWYDQCRALQYYSTNSTFPSTPDAVESWFTQSRTGQHIATQTGPPSTAANKTSSLDRPADWRRLLDEVPESP